MAIFFLVAMFTMWFVLTIAMYVSCSLPSPASIETDAKMRHCVQSLCHGRIVCIPSRPPIALGRVQLQVLPRCRNCFRTSFFHRYRRGTSLPLLKLLRSVADLMALRCTDPRRSHSVNLSNINLYFSSLFSVRFIVCRIHPTLSFLRIRLHHHLEYALYNLFLSPSFSLNSLLQSDELFQLTTVGQTRPGTTRGEKA